MAKSNEDKGQSREIYFLSEYNWEKGILLKECRKNYKIWYPGGSLVPHEKFVAKDKCAFPEEEVCIVWETWKGVNGRGGYRVEKKKYAAKRVAASKVARQGSNGPGRVTEETEGILQTTDPVLDFNAGVVVDLAARLAPLLEQQFGNLGYQKVSKPVQELLMQTIETKLAYQDTVKAYEDLLCENEELKARLAQLEKGQS